MTTLDDATEKLVKAARRSRPLVDLSRLTENRVHGGMGGYPANPLYTGILAFARDPGVTENELSARFCAINAKLSRFHIVRSLCILGDSCFTWGVSNSKTNQVDIVTPERLLPCKLVPVKHSIADGAGALYPQIVDLLGSINSMVLPSEDIAAAYGQVSPDIVTAPSLEIDPHAADGWHNLYTLLAP